MFDFEVKIAQSQEEIKKAQRLRYEIFRLEMGAGALSTVDEPVDKDIHDKYCEHLIVIDKTVDKVVGTYRFLLGSRVEKKIGFYSEKFFNISNIKKLDNDFQVMELGRSCIHRDYRSHPVINLLWNGIARYIKDYNVRYLFGVARLLSNDPLEVSRVFRFLRKRFYAGPRLRVYPKPKSKFHGLKRNIKLENPREIIRLLPPLVKGYLRAGVLVCGLPAVDTDLDSVVVFILLDVENLTRSYKEHFL